MLRVVGFPQTSVALIRLLTWAPAEAQGVSSDAQATIVPLSNEKLSLATPILYGYSLVENEWSKMTPLFHRQTLRADQIFATQCVSTFAMSLRSNGMTRLSPGSFSLLKATKTSFARW